MATNQIIALNAGKLDLAKNQSFKLPEIRMRQGDKGYHLAFALDANFQQYNPSADTLGFKMLKTDGQMIDMFGEGFKQTADGWDMALPNEVAQSPTPGLLAHIYVRSDGIDYSTSSITFYILPEYGKEAESNSYVTAINEIMNQANTVIKNLESWANKAGDIANAAQGAIDAKIAEMSQQVTNWTTTTLANLTKALSDKQAALDKLNVDYSTGVANINAKLVTINEDWASRAAGYDTAASGQRTEIKASADTALAKVAADAKDQRDVLTTQFNDTFLTGLNADFEALKKQWTASLADLQAALTKAQGNQADLDERIKTAQATLDAITAKIQTIDPDAINAAILKAQQTANDAKTAAATAQTAADGAKADAKTANDGVTTINGKIGTVPAGSNIMAEIAKGGKVQSVNGTAPDAKGNVTIALPSVAGMVKSATINGGTKVTADASGNLPLTVPDPDLSPYDTAAQAAVKVSQAKADAISAAKQETTNQVTASRNSTVWTGTQAQYDALTPAQRSQYLILGVTK